MKVTETTFFTRFARMCEDGFQQGWHEANGGNVSYRMAGEDVAAAKSAFSFDRPWAKLDVQADNLKGSHFLVTGSGKFLHNAQFAPADTVGIAQINDAGDAWRIVWGLDGGGRPTSEFPTHFMCHSIRMAATDGANRVIYHAHCPNVIALSTLIEPDARTWTRALWKLMTECVIVFPQGLGVVPWMVPGSTDIARATAKLMSSHDAVVWTQHGMFVSGSTFDAAFGMMHTIEKAAGLYLSARAASGGKDPAFMISDEHLLQVAHTYGAHPNPDFLDGESNGVL